MNRDTHEPRGPRGNGAPSDPGDGGGAAAAPGLASRAAERESPSGRRSGRPSQGVLNPAADRGLNPLTTGAAGNRSGPAAEGRNPEPMPAGTAAGPWEDPAGAAAEETANAPRTPLPYNPVSNSVAFQHFLASPDEFQTAPQTRRPDPPGAGRVSPRQVPPPGDPPGPWQPDTGSGARRRPGAPEAHGHRPDGR